MYNRFGKVKAAALIIFCLLYAGCASELFPEMSVDSCTWDDDGVSIVFSLEPDMMSVEKAFTLTEDDRRHQNKLRLRRYRHFVRRKQKRIFACRRLLRKVFDAG